MHKLTKSVAPSAGLRHEHGAQQVDMGRHACAGEAAGAGPTDEEDPWAASDTKALAGVAESARAMMMAADLV